MENDSPHPAVRGHRLVYRETTPVERVKPHFSVFQQKLPGGGGDSNIKKVGVFVVSFRDVNFRFWSRLGC